MCYENDIENLMQILKITKQEIIRSWTQQGSHILTEEKWNIVKDYDSYFKRIDRPIPCDRVISPILMHPVLGPYILAILLSSILPPSYYGYNEALSEATKVLSEEMEKYFNQALSNVQDRLTYLIKEQTKTFEDAFAAFEKKYGIHYYSMNILHICAEPVSPFYSILQTEIPIALQKAPLKQWLIPKPTVYRCAMVVKRDACRLFDVELLNRDIRELLDYKLEKAVQELEAWLRKSNPRKET